MKQSYVEVKAKSRLGSQREGRDTIPQQKLVYHTEGDHQHLGLLTEESEEENIESKRGLERIIQKERSSVRNQ